MNFLHSKCTIHISEAAKLSFKNCLPKLLATAMKEGILTINFYPGFIKHQGGIWYYTNIKYNIFCSAC